MKVALVYDRVSKVGGAERVLLALSRLWPEAPLFTAVYNAETAPWAKRFRIKTSFLQYLPQATLHHEWLAWLTPLAFAKLDFSSFDIVISVTSAEAKNIQVSPQTLHVCYCLTPTRYLWSAKTLYENQGIRGLGLRLLGPWLRAGDYHAAQKPDLMLAISRTVKARIKKYYGRESVVIYPPVETKKFSHITGEAPKMPVGKKAFYLIVSRLVAYKKIDLAIRAFNRLKKPLVIVGKGEREETLRRLAGPTIFFTGQLTDEELVSYYQSCRAVVFPGEEDFGLVAVEAQAAGKAVVGYREGGIGETVIHGKTGWLFSKQTPAALEKAIIEFETKKFSAVDCRKQAQKFDKIRFQKQFKILVEAQWQKRQKGI